MEQQAVKIPFWRLFGPLLLYWLISSVAKTIGEAFALFPYMVEQIAKSGVDDLGALERAMQMTPENIERIYNLMAPYTVQILAFAALATIPLTLTLFFMDRKREKILNVMINKKAPIWKYGAILLFGVVVCIGLNNLITMSNLAFYSESYQDVSAQLYFAGLFVQVICIGIITPIAEEMMFRGVLFKRYRETGSFGRAAGYSAIFFSVMHGNLVQMIFALVLGLLLAYVYEKYGSIKAPILLHIVINLTSLIGTKTGLFSWLLEEPLRVGIATVICAFVASSVFVWIQRIEEKPEGTEKPTEEKITPDMFR